MSQLVHESLVGSQRLAWKRRQAATRRVRRTNSEPSLPTPDPWFEEEDLQAACYRSLVWKDVERQRNSTVLRQFWVHAGVDKRYMCIHLQSFTVHILIIACTFYMNKYKITLHFKRNSFGRKLWIDNVTMCRSESFRGSKLTGVTMIWEAEWLLA